MQAAPYPRRRRFNPRSCADWPLPLSWSVLASLWARGALWLASCPCSALWLAALRWALALSSARCTLQLASCPCSALWFTASSALPFVPALDALRLVVAGSLGAPPLAAPTAAPRLQCIARGSAYVERASSFPGERRQVTYRGALWLAALLYHSVLIQPVWSMKVGVRWNQGLPSGGLLGPWAYLVALKLKLKSVSKNVITNQVETRTLINLM